MEEEIKVDDKFKSAFNIGYRVADKLHSSKWAKMTKVHEILPSEIFKIWLKKGCCWNPGRVVGVLIMF